MCKITKQKTLEYKKAFEDNVSNRKTDYVHGIKHYNTKMVVPYKIDLVDCIKMSIFFFFFWWKLTSW